MEQGFTHFDEQGNARMVDISEKKATSRMAVAKGSILVSREIMEAVSQKQVPKGDVLGIARTAGIMGVKQTPYLIPLCHTLLLDKCSVDFELFPEENRITAYCTVQCQGKTGVEMEALTGVSVALLTVYDMCKAMDKTMEIGEIYLVKKTGGKSGNVYNDLHSRRAPEEEAGNTCREIDIL